MKGIQKLNEVLTMHMGPDYILVNLSIEYSGHIRTARWKNKCPVGLFDKAEIPACLLMQKQNTRVADYFGDWFITQ